MAAARGRAVPRQRGGPESAVARELAAARDRILELEEMLARGPDEGEAADAETAPDE